MNSAVTRLTLSSGVPWSTRRAKVLPHDGKLRTRVVIPRRGITTHEPVLVWNDAIEASFRALAEGRFVPDSAIGGVLVGIPTANPALPAMYFLEGAKAHEFETPPQIPADGRHVALPVHLLPGAIERYPNLLLAQLKKGDQIVWLACLDVAPGKRTSYHWFRPRPGTAGPGPSAGNGRAADVQRVHRGMPDQLRAEGFVLREASLYSPQTAPAGARFIVVPPRTVWRVFRPDDPELEAERKAEEQARQEIEEARERHRREEALREQAAPARELLRQLLKMKPSQVDPLLGLNLRLRAKFVSAAQELRLDLENLEEGRNEYYAGHHHPVLSRLYDMAFPPVGIPTGTTSPKEGH